MQNQAFLNWNRPDDKPAGHKNSWTESDEVCTYCRILSLAVVKVAEDE